VPGFTHNALSARFLQNLIHYAANENINPEGVSDNALTECAVYPESGRIAFVNNSAENQTAACTYRGKGYSVSLEPYRMAVIEI
jgi:hypothetical protein